MTLNQLEASKTAATPEEAARMIASFKALLHSPIQTTTQAAEISEAVKRLSVPAPRKWIAGRVATLLSQYFASSVPSEMMTAIAEDWHDELQPYPAWALQVACRWWMSAANPERRKKPLPGDIAARAKFEMGGVNLAAGSVSRFHKAKPEPRVEPTPEARKRNAEYAAQAGYTPKRFGGAV